MMYKRNRLRMLSVIAFAAMLVGTVGLTFAAGSGSKQGSSSKEKDQAKHVEAELNAQALMAVKNARVPMVLLDARGPSADWIDGAKPLAHNADEKDLRRAVPSKKQLVVTYCGGPECPMSLMLADRLADMGYQNVIRFTGGATAWEQAGYELKSDEKKKPGSGSKPKKPGSGSK